MKPVLNALAMDGSPHAAIDRSLNPDMLNRQNGRVIVKATIRPACNPGPKVVVEGQNPGEQ